MKRKSSKRPKLGQHFLSDESILARIADAVSVTPGQHALEIGPGRGALTKHLLARGAHITAIEVDPNCIRALASLNPQPGTLEVLERDILDTDLSALVANPPVRIAGNLPYYITSPILRAVYAASASFTHAAFLIQKEVAQRLCAQPATRDYGYLTVLTQLHATPTLLFEVPPESFQPPPKVDSAVVRLDFHHGPPPDAAFLKFAMQCFREPRKTLRNNLKPHYSRESLHEHVPEFARAEELPLSELQALFKTLSKPSP